MLTEGRPDSTGRSMAREVEKLHVPIVVILDSAIAYALEALKSAAPHPEDHAAFILLHDVPCHVQISS